MEVWALEVTGALQAAGILRQSTSLWARSTAIVRGDRHFEAGIPESFNVLVKELRSLGLNVELEQRGF